MNARSIRYFILVAGSFFLFTACPRPAPVVPSPPPLKVSKEEVIKSIKQNSLQVAFLQSNFKAVIEYPKKTKLKKHSFEGAILYRKNAQELRLQSLGTFGNTIFDLLYKPHEVTLYIPSTDVVYRGAPGQLQNSDTPDLFSFLQEIINGMEGNYDWKNAEFSGDSLKIKNGDLSYFLKINSRSLCIEKKTIAHHEAVVAEIFYQDHKKFRGKVFPGTIKAFFPIKKTTIIFNFNDPIINERLTDRLFILPLHSEITVLPLSQLNDFLPG